VDSRLTELMCNLSIIIKSVDSLSYVSYNSCSGDAMDVQVFSEGLATCQLHFLLYIVFIRNYYTISRMELL
jgi:hypothetical protein